ncbi:hypothetical protein EDB92DRAFT_1957814 [Lactarius akahatsu]|uniref:F-box domain-containing protein n=1 Tax=Lactarius akahatsu TaxID=416441 RepID=A0AAD4L5P1_9AGAM|nr:hypothetical protein EDB92DRAFT_1957814 [Lactarius akahatsu]
MLPFEILTAIFEKVDNIQDLSHVQTASCTFCAAAMPTAFRNLSLPQLEAVDLKFYSRYRDRLDSGSGDCLSPQACILTALTASFSFRAPPNLTSLSLYNLRISNLSPLEYPPFQTVLKTLQHLQLSVTVKATDTLMWFHFWGVFCPHTILPLTQPALTELTLHSDSHVGASSGLSFAGLDFPHLCVLSLCKLVFEPSVGVKPFILRHTATLARLELIACRLPVDPWDLEPHPGPGGWDLNWDCFAAELTALVALHVDERSRLSWDSPSIVYRYVFPNPTRISYLETDALKWRIPADIAALQCFHTTVAARSEEARRVS